MKKILITGAKGFLGQHVSRYFKQMGYNTYGIGHGSLSVEKCKQIGLDSWCQSDIDLSTLKKINQKFDLIIHCGGSGSVGFSVEHPYKDFRKTVDGTLEVLEYMRLYNEGAHLIYPSSPAVQGECRDEPISEDYIGRPASPYGYHKKISEDLCRSYSEKYNLKVSIVRLFSVYGNGLKKQLLWDACNKILNATSNEVIFWGTGKETRDFIHIDDVLKIFKNLIDIDDTFFLINGATGKKHTIEEVVYTIKQVLGSNSKIHFNNQVNKGNPIYYWGDITKIDNLYKHDYISLIKGITMYIEWLKEYSD